MFTWKLIVLAAFVVMGNSTSNLFANGFYSNERYSGSGNDGRDTLNLVIGVTDNIDEPHSWKHFFWYRLVPQNEIILRFK
ncbi:hypothetical protein Btru_043797 [Bulinus truncatus]|nr:hypothetical protein Btru_043797 [Bulinus truncatus]